MRHQSELDISPRDLLRIVFRHKGKMSFLFLIMFGGTLAYLILQPPVYRSESKLFLRLGRENVAIDQTATMGQAPLMAVPSTRENEVNSIVDVLSSRGLIEKVVDELGASFILESATRASDGAGTSKGSVWDRNTPASAATQREDAIRRVEKKLQIVAQKNSNVITVAYNASSSAIAQETVRALVDVYLQEHLRINRPPGAYDFFVEQTEAIRSRLAAAEDEWLALKNETGLAVIEDQRRLVVEQISTLEDEFRKTKSESAAIAALVEVLGEQIATMPPQQESSRTDGLLAAGADGMRQQFYALQLQEQELRAKYTDQHVLVKKVRDQIRQASAALDQEETQRSQVTTSTNRIFEEAQLSLVNQQSLLGSLRAKGEVLSEQLVAARGQLTEINTAELRFVQLQRQVELHDASYRRYSESMERSRVDQALEIQRMSNISIVQPASAPERPVDSGRLSKLVLGLFASLFACFGLAILAESCDRSLKTSEEVEMNLGLPSLVSVPRFRDAADNGSFSNGRR